MERIISGDSTGSLQYDSTDVIVSRLLYPWGGAGAGVLFQVLVQAVASRWSKASREKSASRTVSKMRGVSDWAKDRQSVISSRLVSMAISSLHRPNITSCRSTGRRCNVVEGWPNLARKTFLHE